MKTRHRRLPTGPSAIVRQTFDAAVGAMLLVVVAATDAGTPSAPSTQAPLGRAAAETIRTQARCADLRDAAWLEPAALRVASAPLRADGLWQRCATAAPAARHACLHTLQVVCG